MSKKLVQAVASGHVEVQNVSSGQISLRVGGQSHILSPQQKLDLTKLVPKAADCLKIGGLKNQLAARALVLV